MAMSLQEQLRAKRIEAERWIRAREAQVRRTAAAAESKGREVYAQTIKSGQRVLARTPAEIRGLGEAALRGQLPQALGRAAVTAAAPRSMPLQPSARKAAPTSVAAKPALAEKAKREIAAAVSGFVDEATLGGADHVLAAGNAIGEAIRDQEIENLLDAYKASMAAKRTADEYDAKHHGASRTAGRAAGFVSTVAALGAPALTRAAITRLPRGVALAKDIAIGAKRGPDLRGLTTLAAIGGGGSGAGGQVATDFVTARKGDLADVSGAAVGGAAGGVATRFLGPTAGGAVGGAVTSAATDILHGDAPSLDRAFGEGRSGAVFGRAADLLGRNWIAGQSAKMKGELGEFFTQAKATARGDRIIGAQTPVSIGGGRKTVADTLSHDRTGAEIISEAKMGPGAQLSANQKAARAQRGDRYIVDHWRFSDVGAAAAGGVSPVGVNILDGWYED